MWRQFTHRDERIRVFDLASKVLSTLLDHFNEFYPFEFVNVSAFSSSVMKLPVSYDEVKKRLTQIPSGDKSEIVQCLKTFIRNYHHDWTSYQPVNLIIISDGMFSVQDVIENPLEPIIFPFPCRIFWFILNNYEAMQHRIEPLKSFFRNPTQAFDTLYTFENGLSFQSVSDMATKLCKSHFSPHNGMLRFGFKESEISLFPPPAFTLFESKVDFLALDVPKSYPICGDLFENFPEDLNIFGFLPSRDTQCTPCLTRHLILEPRRPLVTEKSPLENTEDLNKLSSFRVILHNSLLSSGNVAVVKLRVDWFAFIFAANDEVKKRSTNLVLSVLPPGTVIPLLGPVDRIGIPENTQIPVLEQEFSYSSSNSHIWLKYDTLQADITKLQRYAKKMSERQPTFLSELNKLKNAAYCYGYYDLLEVIKQALIEEKNSASDQKTGEFLDYILKQLETAQPGQEIVSGGFEFAVQTQRHSSK